MQVIFLCYSLTGTLILSFLLTFFTIFLFTYISKKDIMLKKILLSNFFLILQPNDPSSNMIVMQIDALILKSIII